ncbi:hypothetical protein Droror1_Dr00004744 [Drosera rotundifolia]
MTRPETHEAGEHPSTTDSLSISCFFLAVELGLMGYMKFNRFHVLYEIDSQFMFSLEEIIRERRSKELGRGDFFDMMSDAENLIDEEAMSLVMDILLAGYETTSTLLSAIAEHQAIRESKDKGEPLNCKDYKNMRFTSNVISEALSVGRLVHVDFGFILETSPGGNMQFESTLFKLSQEMTQLLDPSGVMKSETWYHFVGLCVKGYFAARRYMDGIINTVLMMLDSGLPCFSRGDPIGNLRKRFHPEMSEREATNL